MGSEENNDHHAKRRNLAEMINACQFDTAFHQMAQNCELALNECEKVLKTLQETPNLADQIELNEQLNLRMEDIYPDIEKTDSMTSTALTQAPNKHATYPHRVSPPCSTIGGRLSVFDWRLVKIFSRFKFWKTSSTNAWLRGTSQAVSLRLFENLFHSFFTKKEIV